MSEGMQRTAPERGPTIVTITADDSGARIPGVMYHGEIPVPYVASWTSETDVIIRPDKYCEGRPAIFRTGARGEGRPVFGKMSEARVRECVARGLCQVCHQTFGNRCYVADVQAGLFKQQYPVLNEPPCCLRCYRVAILRCPGIVRMRKQVRFIAARVHQFRAIYTTLRPTPEGDAILNAALEAWQGTAPIGYARVALLGYDVVALPRDTA